MRGFWMLADVPVMRFSVDNGSRDFGVHAFHWMAGAEGERVILMTSYGWISATLRFASKATSKCATGARKDRRTKLLQCPSPGVPDGKACNLLR